MNARTSAVRTFAVVLALTTLLTLPNSALATPLAQEKAVDVTIEVVGNIDGIDPDELEDLAERTLDAAEYAIDETGGSGIIVIHIIIAVDDSGDFTLRGSSGDWDDEETVDAIDAIDDMIAEMINDFIEAHRDMDGDDDDPDDDDDDDDDDDEEEDDDDDDDDDDPRL